MAIVSLDNESAFTLHVLHKKGIVIVDFWAPWCEPCKMIRAEIQRAAEAFKDQVEWCGSMWMHFTAWRKNMISWRYRHCFSLKMANRPNGSSAMHQKRKYGNFWQHLSEKSPCFDSKNVRMV